MCVGGGGEDMMEAREVAGEDGIVKVGGRSVLGRHDDDGGGCSCDGDGDGD